MTQQDLSDAYENGKYIPGSDGFAAIWERDAAAFRDQLAQQGRAELDIAYGEHPREQLDLFMPAQPPVGLVVFVHGGYWKATHRSLWSHFAQGALAHGFAVAMPSYVLAPEARISGISQQIRAAIEKAAGLVAGPIRLTGHSAGGHLVSRMLCGDMEWSGCFCERIEKVVSISGLHDLRPIMQTDMNAVLALDLAEAQAESPALQDAYLPVPITAWVGGAERPAFLDQAKWLEDAWDTATMVVDPGRHHFDVIDALKDPNSPLITDLLG